MSSNTADCQTPARQNGATCLQAPTPGQGGGNQCQIQRVVKRFPDGRLVFACIDCGVKSFSHVRLERGE